ncbi:MAG: hypothetical protein OIN89_08515 [Candidatus Methanoperedens sp.]|nr:hypothetical protein [Candidatus Methanoperedens sp.]PKL53373.1 MAG: hypothetical protein CVV36_07530 [Candidatus Methanoperedenaceae archaeon HGW-Methanoperedenaceae-1]
MKNNKILLIFLIIILTPVFLGCIDRQSSYVSYSIYVTPDENSETTLIVPVVIDNKSGEIDEVMTNPKKFSSGGGVLETIETDKGLALKIIINEEVEIDFSKEYKEITSDLMRNKTLSMTNLNYDENGKPVIKSWVYVNSSAGQVPRFFVSLHIGENYKVQFLRFGWQKYLQRLASV